MGTTGETTQKFHLNIHHPRQWCQTSYHHQTQLISDSGGVLDRIMKVQTDF